MKKTLEDHRHLAMTHYRRMANMSEEERIQHYMAGRKHYLNVRLETMRYRLWWLCFGLTVAIFWSL